MTLAYLRNIIIFLILLVSASLYFASVVPAGLFVEVKAEVLSRTARSGPTGNVGVLICKLDSGNRVSVDLPPHGKAQIGDRVLLRSYERYIFGDKYQFAGKLITDSS